MGCKTHCLGNEYCVLAVDGVEVITLKEPDGISLWEAVEEGYEAGLVINLGRVSGELWAKARDSTFSSGLEAIVCV